MNKMKIDLTKIPEKPGCYLHKNSDNKIIYVGKAKNLKKRVTSYFQNKKHDEKTAHLVKNISFVDFIITDTEVEALLLENTLIKKHRPKYNIDLKDSKRYAYLRISDEEYPRLLTARDKKEKGKYFGPFTSGAARESLRVFLIKTFKIRTCRKLPKKECLRYHIDLCDAPCITKVSKKEYMSGIKKAEEVLSGKTEDVIKQLKQEMKEHSKNTDYEKAQTVKNQIEGLLWLSEKQNMERTKRFNEDIINFIIEKDKAYIMLFNIYKGILDNKRDYELELTSKITEDILEQFMIQYYSENPVPKEIIIPKQIDISVKKFLEQKRTGKIIFTIPQMGEKKQLLKLVLKNIEHTFLKENKSLQALKDALNLDDSPKTIECFDISHLGGTNTVASMVQFRNGLPDKKNYRRFRIRTVEGIDDFAAIGEVVRRRYFKLVINKEELPDLIVIDGGKGQLGHAIQELKALNVKIPIISLAKKFEEIYIPGRRRPIKLPARSEALKLLQRIRDEAHRFAIQYNRLLRKKEIK